MTVYVLYVISKFIKFQIYHKVHIFSQIYFFWISQHYYASFFKYFRSNFLFKKNLQVSQTKENRELNNRLLFLIEQMSTVENYFLFKKDSAIQRNASRILWTVKQLQKKKLLGTKMRKKERRKYELFLLWLQDDKLP